MVELMRNAVETLKTAEDVKVKTEVRASPPIAPFPVFPVFSPYPLSVFLGARVDNMMLMMCHVVVGATTRRWRRSSEF
jgi:hypothetical protein